jgi:hypothetical protein
MALFANLQVHFPADFFTVLGLGVVAPGAMADLAPGVFKLRVFDRVLKTPRFSISGGMAFIAILDFLGGQPFLHLFDALEGMRFFGIFPKIIELIGMTPPAGFRSHVAIYFFLRLDRSAQEGQEAINEQAQ